MHLFGAGSTCQPVGPAIAVEPVVAGLADLLVVSALAAEHVALVTSE